MVAIDLCPILGLLLLPCNYKKFAGKFPVNAKSDQKFDISHQWSNVNFTWPSQFIYESAFFGRTYVPENNAISGIKFYNDRVYVTLPRFRSGTPVTVASFPANPDGPTLTNVPLEPFPSWDMNVQPDCSSFQNVQSLEIDTKGIMYVLDGNRYNNLTSCPPKIVLLDLNNKGAIIQTYIVPNEISRSNGGSLNDLVIDETDGGYAYISETSDVDPGLIVYSRRDNRAWKFRDRTMMSEVEFVNFTVAGILNDMYYPIDGIAMSPPNQSGERKIFYSPVTTLRISAISSNILKNESLPLTGSWRGNIEFIGKKSAQSDGMVMDNQSNLYFGLLPTYGIGKWNSKEPFTTAKIVQQDPKIVVWPDSFGMDLKGNLYVMANGIIRFVTTSFPLTFDDTIKMRILKIKTGTRSYLYPQ